MAYDFFQIDFIFVIILTCKMFASDPNFDVKKPAQEKYCAGFIFA